MPTSVAISAAIGGGLGFAGIGTGALLAGSLGGFLLGATIWGGLAAAQYLIARVFGPKQRQLGIAAQNANLRIENSHFPARWILGRAKTGGALAGYYVGTDAADDPSDVRTCAMVIYLGRGACEAIEDIWIEGIREGSAASEVPGRQYWLRAEHVAGRRHAAGKNDPMYTRTDMRPYQNQDTAPANTAALVPNRGLKFSGGQAVAYFTNESGPGGEGAVDKTVRSAYALQEDVDADQRQHDNYVVVPFLGAESGPRDLSNLPDHTPKALRDDLANPAGYLPGRSFVVVVMRQPSLGQRGDHPGFPGRLFWKNQRPRWEFLVKGIKIEEPDGTEAWTNSTPSVIRWFLRNRANIPAGAIPTPQYNAAKAVSDASVDLDDSKLPGTGYAAYRDRMNPANRYTADGVIASDDDPRRVLTELNFTWAGELVDAGGRILMLPGADRPPVKTLRDRDIVRRVEIRSIPAIQDRRNAVTMSMAQSAVDGYRKMAMPEFVDTVAEARDKQRFSEDLGERAFVQNPLTLGRLMATALRRSRAQIVYVFELAPGAAYSNHSLLPGDRVMLTHTRSRLNNALLEVIDRTITETSTVMVSLQQVETGTYADTLVLPPQLPGAVALPPQFTSPVPALTGLTISGAAVFVEDAAIETTVVVNWTDDETATEITLIGPGGYRERRRTLAAGPETFFVTRPGEYTAQARRIAADGALGPVASASTTVSWGVLSPPQIEGMAAVPFAILDSERLSLSLGCVVSWDTTAFDVVLSLARGTFETEVLVETGVESARFDVPEPGTYTLTGWLQHRGTGIRSDPVVQTVAIATTALTPGIPAVTTDTFAEAADDGTIHSRVTIAWAETADRTRVDLTGPDGFSAQADQITGPAVFEVETPGVYTYTVRHYNAAAVGPSAIGTVTLSWAHLAPTTVLDVRSFAAAGTDLVTILAPIPEPDVNGIEIRYRRVPLGSGQTLSEITAADFDNPDAALRAPLFGTFPITLGALGNNIIIHTPVQESGRYRVYARPVNTAQLGGPVVELGTTNISIPTTDANSANFAGLWRGTFDRIGVLPDTRHFEGQFPTASPGFPQGLLVFDPGDAHLLSRAQLNGQQGWPLGREAFWTKSLPRAQARETPTAARARWRVGSNGLTASDELPRTWLAGGPSDITQYLRDVNLSRTGSVTTVTARFRPDPGTGFSQDDPFLIPAIEDEGTWTLSYGPADNRTVIDLGAPGKVGGGAVVDSTNPYDWTPATAVQAALGTLMDGLASGSITEVTLGIEHSERPSYLTPVIDLGEAANWRIVLAELRFSPPNPPVGLPQSPPSNQERAYTLHFGLEEANLDQSRVLEVGVAQQVSAQRYVQIELRLARTWSGTGIHTLRLDWAKVL